MRANLLILGKPLSGGNPAYGGTDRNEPSYCHELPDEHPVNQAWYWMAHDGEGRVVHDMARALQALEVFRRHGFPEMELIEVTSEDSAPIYGREFLGYGPSAAFYDSFLWSGLITSESNDTSERPVTWKTVTPLLRLIDTHFGPRINQNGLFADLLSAQFCLQCMVAVQAFCSDKWESGDYHIVSVYRVA